MAKIALANALQSALGTNIPHPLSNNLLNPPELLNAITGTATHYAGGGGGHGHTGSAQGGIGGGGLGASHSPNITPGNGTDGLGGGGGGSHASPSGSAGRGGSGIVIVRFSFTNPTSF